MLVITTKKIHLTTNYLCIRTCGHTGTIPWKWEIWKQCFLLDQRAWFFNVYRDVIRTLSDIYDRIHCVKNVQIQSYFWSVFSYIWTEYGDLLSIQSEYRKIRTRNNSAFGHFSHSGYSATKTLYFHKRAPSHMFDRVPDTPLIWQIYMFITLHIQLNSDLKGIERYRICDTCWSRNADELFFMNSSATTCSWTVRHATARICVTLVYLYFLTSGRVLTHSLISWFLRFYDFLGNAHPLIPNAKKHYASVKKVGKNSPFCYPILNAIMLWR